MRAAAAGALGLSITAGGTAGGAKGVLRRASAPIMGLAAGPRASAGAAGAAAAVRRLSKAGGGKGAAASAGRQNFVRYQKGGQAKRSFQ